MGWEAPQGPMGPTEDSAIRTASTLVKLRFDKELLTKIKICFGKRSK